MHAYAQIFSMQDRPAAQTVPGKKQSAPARAPDGFDAEQLASSIRGVSLGTWARIQGLGVDFLQEAQFRKEF